MTRFRVVLTDQAAKEAEAAYLWILDRSPQGAARWWDGFEEAVLSLAMFPERCPLAPESDVF